jgi:dihydroorotate dehydrogenase (NAD+) catalytic subunit
MKPDMTVNLAGIALRNPVMTASGTFGYGAEFAEYVNLESIGAFVTKGLSLKPRAGNPTPRIVETPGGMLNAIGLQNVGLSRREGPLSPLGRYSGHCQFLRQYH